MATLEHQFDPNTVPDDEFDPVPNGTYLAQIVESDLKATKNGNGQIIKLKWAIMDGPQKGRFVFDNINYRNTNAQAEEIGAKQFKKIIKAVGLAVVSDTTQLHLRPARITVEADGQYTRVKRYEPAGGGAPPSTVSLPVANEPQQQAAAGGRPWKR
jgi:hypothetical protein